MKVQPDPCPLGICREIEIQTKTRDTIEWVHRCQACGRVRQSYSFDLKSLKDVEDASRIRVQKGETYAQAAARWKAQEEVQPQGHKELENTDRTSRKETYSAALKRWRAQEVTGYVSNRRKRHAAAKGIK